MSKRDRSQRQQQAKHPSTRHSEKKRRGANTHDLDVGSGAGVGAFVTSRVSKPAPLSSDELQPAATIPYSKQCPVRVLFNPAAAVMWSRRVLKLTDDQRRFFQRADIYPKLIDLWMAFAKMIYTQKGIPYFSALGGKPALMLLRRFLEEAKATLQFCLKDEEAEEAEDRLTEDEFDKLFITALNSTLGLDTYSNTTEARAIRGEIRGLHLEKVEYAVEDYRQRLIEQQATPAPT